MNFVYLASSVGPKWEESFMRGSSEQELAGCASHAVPWRIAMIKGWLNFAATTAWRPQHNLDQNKSAEIIWSILQIDEAKIDIFIFNSQNHNKNYKKSNNWNKHIKL